MTMDGVAAKQGCGCVCHSLPGVSHIVACCSAPKFEHRKDVCPLCGLRGVQAENQARMLVCRICLEDPDFIEQAKGDWR